MPYLVRPRGNKAYCQLWKWWEDWEGTSVVGEGARGCAVTWSTWDARAKASRPRHSQDVCCRLVVWAHELAFYSQSVTKLAETTLESQGPVALLTTPRNPGSLFIPLLNSRECLCFLPKVTSTLKYPVLGEPADSRG